MGSTTKPDDQLAGGALAQLLAPLLGRAQSAPPPLDAATWHDLAGQAVRERLGPLLHAALQRSARTYAPAAVRAALAQEHCRAAAAALYQQQELAAILRACAEAQIPSVVLKGAALALTLYPDPALRPCGDLDLLLPSAAVPHVLRMLEADGYINRYHARRADGRLPRDTCEYHYSRGGAQPAIVEPHWHITSSPYYVRRLPVTWFWQQTEHVTFGAAPALVLAPPAQFLHLVTHYFLHYLGHHRLWSFDLALLLVRHAATWDWETLAGQAARFGLVIFARRALRLVEQEWGVVLPDAYAAALDRVHPDYGERVAVWAMERPGAPPWRLWQAAYAPSPGQRLRLLVRLVLPGRNDLRKFQRSGARRRMAAAHCQDLARLPRDLSAAVCTLWRLRRQEADAH